MSKAGPAPSKSRSKPHSKSHGKAGDDGFVQFIKNPDTRMRAVVTACGHGGKVSEKGHARTRETTKEATSALQSEDFRFYVFRVQGDTYSPGLAWSSAGIMPSNFSQYNPEITRLLNEPDNRTLLETGELETLIGNIGRKIKEIDTKSGVEYGSREEAKTHPPEVVSSEDFYIMYTPENPPREDHRLIATYAGPGEMLRTEDDSKAQLPRREAVRDMPNIRFFKSYGLFCVDSTDEVDQRGLCLTGARIETKRADKDSKKTEYHELKHEGLYNLFSHDKIAEVVHLIGWRHGFFLRKETKRGVKYKRAHRRSDKWNSFHDALDGPVQKFLHAAFYQEISYHDIISIWKDGLLYDDLIFLDVACNCPSVKDDWEYFKPRRTLTVSDMIRRDPREDGYDKPGPAGSATPPSSSSSSSDSDSESESDSSDPEWVGSDSDSSDSESVAAKPKSSSRAKSSSPPPPRAKSPSPRTKSSSPPRSTKKGGRSRLTKRSKSHQKTSKQLKNTRKRLSRNKKNKRRYTRRRTRR
jgi:hypothetical protein